MSGRIKKRKNEPQSVESVLRDYVAAQAAKVAESASQNPNDDEDETETPDNGMGEVETYAEHMPTKLKIGRKHPDPVVCTASLASVQSAEISYVLKLPQRIIDNGVLSALQLEAVTYASQAHQSHLLETEDSQRAGFLIGDGAGVGKGRTIAGIIYENHLHGRMKSIWISVSNDLKYDAERDLSDIGAPITVHSLSEFKYNSRITATSGVLFSTYALLIAKPTTISKFDTRIKQIVDWCGKDFDGVIVFDECHKAKNLIPANNSLSSTQTGRAVLDLQFALPNARVVYSSATGATEPRNMGYMVRLGIWGVGTSFRNFGEFQRVVERRGVSTMEVVAMDMKLRGIYVARQLSFQGVTFKVEKIPLTEDFIRMYNDSVALWNLALKHFHQAIFTMDVEARIQKIIWGQFWGAHQRFFKYLAIAAKVDHAVKLTEEAIEAGKCVVIGLQSTGEARMNEEVEKRKGFLDDYISTAKAAFQSLIEKQFPALDRMDSPESEYATEDGIDQPSTSRKKKPVEKFKFDTEASTSRKRKLNQSKSGRKIKRPRIASSSDDDSLDEWFDNIESTAEGSESEDEYHPFKKNSKSNDRRNHGNVKSKIVEDTESEFDSENDVSEDEEEEEDEEAGMSEQDYQSDDSSSDNEVGSKKRKSNISKVQEYLRRIHRDSNRDKKSKKKGVKDDALQNDIIEGARELKAELLLKIEILGERLPKNTLDELINKLGGSEKVAEMTGRKGRVAGTSDGKVKYESRRESGVALQMLNITEKERFMSGKKLIAIISEAASSGISLQSDRRVANQRRRLHMTLELPWAADRAIQQFGRTHRSNQVSPPEYVFLISELAGEQRFVATVARRLESLGALTHADRRATKSRDLAEFNIDNKFGRKALATTLRAIGKLNNPLVPPPEEYEGDFFADVHKALLDVDLNLAAVADEERKSDNIVRFMNRSLGVPVQLQNHLFKYFSDTLHATILKAKKDNEFDPGLMDVGNPERIERISTVRFVRKHATGVSPIELHTVRVDRGITWSQALERSQTLTKAHEGFYISNESKMNRRRAMLMVRLSDDDTQPKDRMMFAQYKPHTGSTASKSENLEHVLRTYHKTTPEKAKDAWIYQYEWSVENCNHLFFGEKCTTSRFTDCDSGKRITTRVVLSGSVLGVWDRVEKQLRGGEDGEGQNIRMQVCRIRSSEVGQASVIGILVNNDCVDDLSEELAADAESVETIDFTDGLESKFPKIEKVEPMEVETAVPIKLEFQSVEAEGTKQQIKAEIKIEIKTEIKTEIVETEYEPESAFEPKMI